MQQAPNKKGQTAEREPQGESKQVRQRDQEEGAE